MLMQRCGCWYSEEDFCMYDGNFLCGYVRGEAGEPEGKDIQAYCGQAENSILPGYVGVGDRYRRLLEILV